MKSLEVYTIQEIQTPRETMVNRLQAKENFEMDTPEAEVQTIEDESDLTLPVPFRVRDDLPKVIMPSPMVYLVTVTEKPATKKHPKGFVECHLEPIHMKSLKGIKKAVVSYGIPSPYVKKLVESWATRYRVTPNDWGQLVSAVLEISPQIEWRALWREEAKALEHQG